MGFGLGIILFLGHLSLLTCLTQRVLGHGGKIKESNTSSCDYFKGSWIYDDSYPLYNASDCPFLGLGFDCLKNGRLDHDYLKYRWQPTNCDIPRFNGVDFLERNRGKKIMLVGDSLSRNMWESLTCMLHSSVKSSNYTINSKGSLSTFTIPDYGISIMLLRNPFLIDTGVDKKVGQILKLDSISTGNQWLGMDYLIFNTYHWWFHRDWNYFQVADKIIEGMDRFQALKIALTTWANWVDNNIDPSKTRVFFQGASAIHANPEEWGDPETMKACNGQTEPIEGSKYPGNSTSSYGEDIIRGVISNMTRPTYLLDVTLLTQLRKDGHPSIYNNIGNHQSDCSHWCLAGVPDSWNHLFYVALLQN